MFPVSGCSSTPLTSIYLSRGKDGKGLDVSAATPPNPSESVPGTSESSRNVPRKLCLLIHNLWWLWGMFCPGRESAAG